MRTQLKQSAPVGLHSASYPEMWQQLRGTGCGSRILQCAEPLQHVFQAHLHAAHGASHGILHGLARREPLGLIEWCGCHASSPMDTQPFCMAFRSCTVH